ncbi:hypothetical protein BT96DRAFT_1016444 [Gymnopus androsaceus JB14]|uniref:Uncharacterized protein n=1 Tax=Gymnopus androsaceus JB14 TaxID=1447944 RepID=A0A6A4HXZ0_9AGAR|nr:hypothetical protein BT96DRAFT_1016444 [Gymnopus androsaceus JB14]
MSKHERTGVDSDTAQEFKKRKIEAPAAALVSLAQMADKVDEPIRASKVTFASLTMKDIRDKNLVPSDQNQPIIRLLSTSSLFPKVEFKSYRLPLSFHERSLQAHYCSVQVYGLPRERGIEESVMRLYEPVINHVLTLFRGRIRNAAETEIEGKEEEEEEQEIPSNLNDETLGGSIEYRFRIIHDYLIVIIEMKTFSEKTLAQMLGELSAMGTRSSKHGVKKVYGMLIEKFSGVYVFEMDIDRNDALIGGSKFQAPTPFSIAPKISAGGDGQGTMESMQQFANMLFTLLMLGLSEYCKSRQLEAELKEMKVIMDKLEIDDEKEREEGLHLLGACLEKFDAPPWSKSEVADYCRVTFPAGLSAEEFKQRLHEVWRRNGSSKKPRVRALGLRFLPSWNLILLPS